VIAIGLAAAIIKNTTTALHASSESIRYATVELQGVRYLSRTYKVLRELLDYRAELVNARVRWSNELRSPSPSNDAPERRILTISASIAAIPDRPSAMNPFDEAIAEHIDGLEKCWLSNSPRAVVSLKNISAAVATIQPLIVGISGASGISNDPSIDGINFGDAIVRFPLSLAYGTEAASIAAVNAAEGDASFRDRVRAARLLAQAQTAIDVGVQDAEDEMSVDPVAGATIARQAAVNVRWFETMTHHITDSYVESHQRAQRFDPDPALTGEVETFASSSFVVIETLRQDLFQTLSARIEQARLQRLHVLLETVGEVFLELVLMLALAWISTVSYRNQRKRMAAERMALELQRAELEGQLTQAKAQQALLRAKAQFRAVFDRAPAGMIILDRQCRILDTNEAAAAILQSEDKPICAESITADHGRTIERIFSGSENSYSEERKYVDDKHCSRWFHVSISPVSDEFGTTLFGILMLRDITDSKIMEERLVFDAGHDALTGLPNRTYFLAMLQRTLDERRGNGSFDVFSVVFIDFNDFKTINDSFGHLAGDKFLIDGAARLRNSVRSTDIVARIGGDEFAIILHGTDRSEIEKNVTRLQSVVSLPVNIEGQLVATSASFGIAQAELSYTLASEIIRDADTAMYQAKAHGGRNFVVFDASMRDRVVRRMQLSIDLVHALEHDELELFYQPIVDLRDGKVSGCEALVRWRRGDGSLMSPTEFLPLAEENGSIIEIGRWVTRTACEQMQTWNDLERSGRLPGLYDQFVIHVNLAVPEVHHNDLLSNLIRTLMETRVARHQIILEITEGIVLKTTEHSRSIFDALTAEGFRLCIDDFGTGYSSLRYINELPLHGFKIDRSFVSNGSDGLANESIVEMLMVLSRSLGLEVVAEGIETHTQWKKLRELGCRYGQGFLFARPLEGRALTTILEGNVALAV
jgi:diguanylate cyclase (GGDEF)-like protein/PAS domain S-box-containing protein